MDTYRTYTTTENNCTLTPTKVTQKTIKTDYNSPSDTKVHRLIQKLMGVILVVIGAVSAGITGDGTAACILLPMGLYTALTKEYILTL